MTHQITNNTAYLHNFRGVELQHIPPLDLKGMIRRIWYGKHVIVSCTVLAVLAAGYYAFAIAQPRYAATTTLEITTPTLEMGQSVPGLVTDPVHINTQVAILQSSHLLVQVVETLDLTSDPEFNRYLTPIPAFSVTGLRNRLRNFLTGQNDSPPDEAAVLEKTTLNLQNAITAKALRDTYVFHITAESGAAAKSALIANTLAQVYLADQVAGRQAETETNVTWLSGKVATLQRQLLEQETAVNDLIAQAHVLDAAAADALGRQAQDTTARLADARADLTAAQSALQQLAAAQTTAATPDDRLVAAVDRHADQVAALTTFQANLNRQLTAHSDGLVRLHQLRREAEATRVIYETFLRRLQESNIQRGLQRTDSRVLATASTGVYVAPRKVLILAAAGLLGALAGIGLIVLRDMLRSGFTDATSLTSATGLPVLSEFARLPSKRGGTVAHQGAHRAVRRLHTALLLQNDTPSPQVVLFTASIHGEGKSATALSFVRHLAELGQSVMLIAADPWADSFEKNSQHWGTTSLTAVLGGETSIADARVMDSRLGADVLALDRSQQGVANLYAGPALTELFTRLRDSYDTIVVDAPPVLTVPESLLLARHADAVLYTVHWNKTPRDLVLAGCNALDRANLAITGLVMAQVNARKLRQFGNGHIPTEGQIPLHGQGLINSISKLPTRADTRWRDHHSVPSGPR